MGNVKNESTKIRTNHREGTEQIEMIGSDFIGEPSPRSCRCSECGGKISMGDLRLVSRRGGVVKKIICSEDCRLTFDDRIWQEFADKQRKVGPEKDLPSLRAAHSPTSQVENVGRRNPSAAQKLPRPGELQSQISERIRGEWRETVRQERIKAHRRPPPRSSYVRMQ